MVFRSFIMHDLQMLLSGSSQSMVHWMPLYLYFAPSYGQNLLFGSGKNPTHCLRLSPGLHDGGGISLLGMCYKSWSVNKVETI